MEKVVIVDDIFVEIDQKVVLKHVTLGLEKGSIIGLLGPSGSGKTTLMRSILGLQPISSGEIKVFDKSPNNRKNAKKIGYVSQSPSIYQDLTVIENLQYFAKIGKASKKSIQEVIDVVDMAKYKNQLVGDLSGGQKTRVSLALALLGEPKLLILDEPTVGLDPVLREKMWHTFKQLNNRGVTVLISSHVMDEADKCDRIIFLREGKVLIYGDKESIYRQTQSSTMDMAFLRLAKDAQ